MSIEEKNPNRKKNLFIEAGYFLSSRYFLLHLSLITGSFTLLLFGIFSFLKMYTHHGDSREVPNLINRSTEGLDPFMKASGLRYRISSERWEKNVKPGIVLEQSPIAGSRVKENRTIYLTVSASQPPPVKLVYRAFIGMLLRDVADRLKALGLEVGETEYIRGKGANTVAKMMLEGNLLFREMHPSRGERPPTEPVIVPKGSKIDLVLYKGIDASPKYIPSLQCLTYGEAEFKIRGNGFVLGGINTVGPITDTVNAFVWKQRPPLGGQASLGTPIKVWLVNELPEACQENYVPPTPSTNNEYNPDNADLEEDFDEFNR